MRHRARWMALAVAVVIAGFGVVLATQVSSSPEYRGGPILGKPAPPFELTDISARNPTATPASAPPGTSGDAGAGAGSKIRLADLAGKTVIVNFWNTWCIPCEQELPELAEFHARHAGDPDVVLVGIVRDDTEKAVREYVAEKRIGWRIGWGGRLPRAAIDYGTTGQPETFVISPSGVVVGKQLSRVGVDDLEAMLAAGRRAG